MTQECVIQQEYYQWLLAQWLQHLKKACNLIKVNWEKLLATNTQLKQQPILLLPVALELDEQWSCVRDKSNQRWLWLALNHYSSEILAYTFRDRTDKTCKQWQQLLKLFNITQYFTDRLGAYQRLLPFEQHEEGRRNSQKIERKFLTFRTRIKRLARKTICFSKSEFMHHTVISLFINRFELAINVWSTILMHHQIKKTNFMFNDFNVIIYHDEFSSWFD